MRFTKVYIRIFSQPSLTNNSNFLILRTNVKKKKNLYLISIAWYWLSQLICIYGIHTYIFLIEWRQSRIVRFESEMWIASDLLPYTLIQYSTWFDSYLNNFVIRALWINMVQKPSISTLVLWTKIFQNKLILIMLRFVENYDLIPQSTIFPLGSGNIISQHLRMWKCPILVRLILQDSFIRQPPYFLL